VIPSFRRDLAAVRSLPAPTVCALEKEEHTVRKTLIALAATTGILGFGTVGASALTLGPVNGPEQAGTGTVEGSVIQKADWYCGPRCQYWHHRRWDERHWNEGARWRNPNYGYNRYGYNGGNGYYYR
jgi:hypothetical protein